jgi:uncharacterized membrane protein (DUF4010 family)
MMLESLHWSHPMRLGVAFALGLLVGLERESAELRRKQRFRAGVRTYAILSLFGFACAWLFQLNVRLALPAGLLAVSALGLVEYLAKIQSGRLGWTSEIAALLTFVVGALSLLADIWVPLALGVVQIILLSEKSELESYVERLDKGEFLAVLKFLLLTLIILPLVPDREYTQFKLNPTRIWEIVIIVSSIGFIGYALSKRLGAKLGLSFSGMLGGIVSSTAVSIAVGRIAQQDEEKSAAALQASLLASSVMYLRILALVAILNPAFTPYLAWRLLALAAIGGLLSIRVARGKAFDTENSVSPSQNPFEIRPALVFATLFTLLSVITELVTRAFGNVGLLALSAIVGVSDIDPYILSLVRGSGAVKPVLVSAILIAAMSNTVIKGVYFGLLAKAARKETFLRYFSWALLHIPFIALFV